MTVNLADLRAAVFDILALSNVSNILQLNSNTRARAFEAYVFALAVRAVRQAGGSAQIWGARTGANPNPVVFRGSPGHMGSTLQDFCFAVCTLNGLSFEIHVGVIYKGSSGATHEVDVSIYDREEATEIRYERTQLPSTRYLHGAFECKCYDSDLDTNLGRAFVGLVSDCGRLRARDFLTNGRSRNLAAYFSKSGRPSVYFQVSPVVPDSAERFVFNLEQVLRQWAKVT